MNGECIHQQCFHSQHLPLLANPYSYLLRIRCFHCYFHQRYAALLVIVGAVIFLSYLASPCLAQTEWANLTVSDPRSPRFDGNNTGTIEEAIVSIRPQGVYMECALFLTYSARGTAFDGKNDSLEVVHSFSLPVGAIVTDSWLWVGDSIMQGRIMDRSTATQIYETIVRRIRKDPSLLVKHSASNFQLSIFPMRGNETRRVKITYLVPTQWSPLVAFTTLPMALLRSSRNALRSITVLTPPLTEWTQPRIIEHENVVFSAGTGVFAGVLRAEVPFSSTAPPLTFVVNIPPQAQSGVWLTTAERRLSTRPDSPTEQFYHLAVLPSVALQRFSGRLSQGRKMTFLIDYRETVQQSTSSGGIIRPIPYDPVSVRYQDALNRIRVLLATHCTPRDSFNIFISGLSLYQASSRWIGADERSVREVFAQLERTPVRLFPNLPLLLRAGVQFVRAHANAQALGQIILFSNTSDIVTTTLADDVLKLLWETSNPLPRFHIVDFSSQGWYGFSDGAGGNDYLYANLVQLAGGSYQRVNYGTLTFNEATLRAMQGLNGVLQALDVNIQPSQGFCFGRYSDGTLNAQGTLADRAFTQIGKFVGQPPFAVQVSAILDNQPLTTHATIPHTRIERGSSAAVQAWMGAHINELEQRGWYSSTSPIVRDIVSLSLSTRVLSVYSAFLALEPNDTLRPCRECSLTNTPPVFPETLPSSASLGALPPSPSQGASPPGAATLLPVGDAARAAYYTPPVFSNLLGAAFVDAARSGFWVSRPTAVLTSVGAQSVASSSYSKRLQAMPQPFAQSVVITVPPLQVSSILSGAMSARHHDARLTVYSVLGQRVRSWTISAAEVEHGARIQWLGDTEAGLPAPAGVYVLVFEVGTHRETTQIVKSE